MADNDQKDSVHSSGLEKTRKLMQQIGGEDGFLGPLVKSLNRLLEDPVLMQTIESLPSDNHKLN